MNDSLLNYENKSLSSYQLKWIAMASMLIDHIACLLLQGSEYYSLCRIIGRVSFPLYCFMAVEGFFHTHSLKKYLCRMGILALLSEIPFNLALNGSLFCPDRQNVLFTLFLGLLGMTGYQYFFVKNLYPLATLSLAFSLSAGWILKTDYGTPGVLILIIFYLLHRQKKLRDFFIALIMVWMAVNQPDNLQAYGMFALSLIHFYKGEKGNSSVPEFFYYAFYPLHLLILYFIAQQNFSFLFL